MRCACKLPTDFDTSSLMQVRLNGGSRLLSRVQRVLERVANSGLLPLSENLFDICRSLSTFHLVNVVNVTTLRSGDWKLCTSCA